MKKRSFDTYGTSLTIEAANSLLTSILGIDFRLHHGDHFGEYFLGGEAQGESFEIKVNFDPTENEPLRLKFSAYSTLIFINQTQRSEVLYTLLTNAGMTHLEHDEFE